MRIIFIFLIAILFNTNCQTTSSRIDVVKAEQVIENSIKENSVESVSIRKIDFQNFTFPWTKTFGYGEKTFSLKHGTSQLSDSRKLSLKSLSYISVADEYDEQALINVKIDDGNATYSMLYIFAIEKDKPKLLESFEFGETTVSLITAFDAHGELVIETFDHESGDAECCPSIIEISHYSWQKDKFVLQGEPQKIANGYLERIRKKNKNN